MPESLSRLTLQQKLNEADKLIRELIQHLEHSAIPQTHLLRRISTHSGDSTEASDVTDVSIRTNVGGLLDAGKFTDEISKRLQSCLTAIHADFDQILQSP